MKKSGFSLQQKKGEKNAKKHLILSMSTNIGEGFQCLGACPQQVWVFTPSQDVYLIRSFQDQSIIEIDLNWPLLISVMDQGH